MQRDRRASVTIASESPASSMSATSALIAAARRRSSSIPSPQALQQKLQQQQPRRRSVVHHQLPQPPQPDSLSSISELGKPTLVLAAYASDEFVDAMRQATRARFTVVPSRQPPPQLRRMSEPAFCNYNRRDSARSVGGGAGNRRHSVDAIIDGPPIGLLSSRRDSQNPNPDAADASGQLLDSFEELDEQGIEDDVAAAAASVRTARALLRSPQPGASSRTTTTTGSRQRHRVAIAPTVWAH